MAIPAIDRRGYVDVCTWKKQQEEEGKRAVGESCSLTTLLTGYPRRELREKGEGRGAVGGNREI